MLFDVLSKSWESLRHSYLLETAYDRYAVCNLGVATQQGGRLSFDQLINNADKALYQAKRAGRNTVQGFNGSVLGQPNL